MTKVTFVVPCYNYAAYVGQAVDSLLRQTYRDIEVIVIDDASTDGTPKALDRFATEPRVRVIRHETNMGHVASYNEGLRGAQGAIVGLLSADDFAVAEDAVERQVAVFDAHPEVGFVYSSMQLVNGDGVLADVMQPHPASYVTSGPEEFARLAWGNVVPASGTLVRKSAHEALGWYEASLPHACDWDLWLRLCSRFGAGFVVEPLYSYRMHDTNMSHATVSAGQAIGEQLRTLDRNFALMPDTPEMRALRTATKRRARYSSIWHDLAHGHAGRVWSGLWRLASQSPGVVFERPFATTTAKAAILTVAGHARYRRRFGGFAY